MLSKALYTKLSGTAGITALVSTRIYPVVLPENVTLPAISYSVVAQPQIHSLEGVTALNSLVQIDCWADTFLASQNVAEAIANAINDFSGTIGSEEKIHSSIQTGKQELFEPDVNDYRVSLDYSIWHTPL